MIDALLAFASFNNYHIIHYSSQSYQFSNLKRWLVRIRGFRFFTRDMDNSKSSNFPLHSILLWKSILFHHYLNTAFLLTFLISIHLSKLYQPWLIHICDRFDLKCDCPLGLCLWNWVRYSSICSGTSGLFSAWYGSSRMICFSDHSCPRIETMGGPIAVLISQLEYFHFYVDMACFAFISFQT